MAAIATKRQAGGPGLTAFPASPIVKAAVSDDAPA